MKRLGLIASALGLLILLSAFGFDTAPEGTHNIGLLQEQLMFFFVGAVLTIIGAVLGSVGHALTKLHSRNAE